MCSPPSRQYRRALWQACADQIAEVGLRTGSATIRSTGQHSAEVLSLFNGPGSTCTCTRACRGRCEVSRGRAAEQGSLC
jgi:hypothetical protein